MFRPALNRTPSVELIDRLCAAVETPTSAASRSSQDALHTFFSHQEEADVLARGQRLADLAVGLQAPNAGHRAAVAARIAPALSAASERFALAWRWGEASDPSPVIDAAVESTTQIANSLAVDAHIDPAATRKACEEAIANAAYHLRMALARAQAFSTDTLRALIEEYRPLMADTEARLQAFTQNAISAMAAAIEAAQDDDAVPTLQNEAEVLGTVQRVVQYVDADIEKRFENLLPVDGDSESLAIFKAHACVRVLLALHEAFKDADFDARDRFYQTPVGMAFRTKAAELAQLSQSILAGPIEEAAKSVSDAAVRTLEADSARTQDFFKQLQEAMYQSFLDSLPDDPEARAAAIQAFEETVTMLTGEPFGDPRG